MNITVDDSSPQWEFASASGGWSLDHTDDSWTPQYFDGTFHGTYNEGDTATLRFNGTAVYIYGAMRPNHGIYSVQVDGGNITYQMGYSGTSQIQAVLFSQTGLSGDQEHSVTVINHPALTVPPGNDTVHWWLDVDYAVITAAETGEIFTTQYDDSSTDITYRDEWGTGPPLRPQEYHDTTAHITSKVGSSASLRFSGSSVQVYGGLYHDHGNYAISLDGIPKGNYNGTWFELHPQATLFFATNLVEGPHELLITNIGQNEAGRFFDLDHIVVNSTVDPATVTEESSSASTSIEVSTPAGGVSRTISTGGPAQTGTSRPISTEITSGTAGTANGTGIDPDVESSTKDNNTGTAAIAGGVTGGVVAVLLLAGLAWWFMRRSKRDSGYGEKNRVKPFEIDGGEPKPYAPVTNVSQPDSYLYRDSLPRALSESNASVTAGGAGLGAAAEPADRSRLPYLTRGPQSATSEGAYPHSVDPPASAGTPSEGSHWINPFFGEPTPPVTASSAGYFAQSPGYVAIPGVSSVGSMSHIAVSPPQTPQPDETAGIVHATPPRSTSKSARPSLPFTTRRTRSSTASSDVPSTVSPGSRLQREGREIDIGPIGLIEEDEEEMANLTHTLPPDYQQATEPLPGQRPDGHR